MDFLFGFQTFAGDLQFRGWFPLWLAITLAVAAAAVVGVLYVLEAGRIGFIPRTLMALIRMAIVAVVAVLLLRPTLEKDTADQKKRPVAVLFDVSGSMASPDPRPDTADQWRAAIALGLENTSPPADGKIPEAAPPVYKPAPGQPSWPTRLQVAQAALSNPKIDLLGKLAKIGPIEFSTFGVRRTPRSPEDLAKLSATESRTALVGSVMEVLAREPNELPAAIVVVTDGRENAKQHSFDELARKCADLGVPLHIYGVGSSSFGQLQLQEVTVPDVLFVDDTVGVPVRYRLSGLNDARIDIALHYEGSSRPLARKALTVTRETERARMENGKMIPGGEYLVIREGGKVVRRQPLDTARVIERTDVLSFVPAKKDANTRNRELTATVRVSYGAAGKTEQTLSDKATRPVQVLDRKIKILVIDSLPRWDFKYLQRALLRDRRVEAKFLLLDGDRLAMRSGPPWMPELAADLGTGTGGKEDLARVKLTLSEEEFRKILAGFDLLILGDIPGTFFTEAHQKVIKNFVTDGGGMIHLAGRWFAPAGWTRRPGSDQKDSLADVLPVEFTSVPYPVELPPGELPPPFFPVLAPAAERNLLVRLEDDPLENADLWGKLDQPDPAGGLTPGKRDRADDFKEWGRKLPPIHWYYPVTRLKPAAEAYLVHPRKKTPAPDNQPMPLLAGHYYGKGYVLYVGFDETWRWRLNEADKYFGRFWSQAVYVAGLPKTLGTKLSQLTMDNTNPIQGTGGQVYARLFNTEVRPILVDQVEAKVVRLDGGPKEKGTEQTVILTAVRVDGKPTGEYVAPLDFNTPGKYALRIKPEGGEPATLEYRVSLPPDDEQAPGAMAEPELRALAKASSPESRAQATGIGGDDGFYREEDLLSLPERVKAQTFSIPRREVEVLWNKWALLLLIGLLTLEWITRKLNSLS